MPYISLDPTHARNDIGRYRKCGDGTLAQTKGCIEQQSGRKYNCTGTLQQTLINREISNLPRPRPPGEVRYGRINRSRSSAVHRSMKDRQIHKKTNKDMVDNITTPCNFRYTKQANMRRLHLPYTRYWVPYPDNDSTRCLEGMATDGSEADPDMMRFFSEYMNSCMRLASYTSDASTQRKLPPVTIPRCRNETPDLDLEEEVTIELPKQTLYSTKTSKRHLNKKGKKAYLPRSPRRYVNEKLEEKPYLNGNSRRYLKSQLAFPISAYASSEERAESLNTDSNHETSCQSDDDAVTDVEETPCQGDDDAFSDVDDYKNKDVCKPRPRSKYLSDVLIKRVPIYKRPDAKQATKGKPSGCSGEIQQPTNTTDEKSVHSSGIIEEQSSATADRTKIIDQSRAPDEPHTSSSRRRVSAAHILNKKATVESTISTRTETRVVPKLYIAKAKDIENVPRLKQESDCVDLLLQGNARVPVSTKCHGPAKVTSSQCNDDQRARSISREALNIDMTDEQLPLAKTSSKDSAAAEDNSGSVVQKSERTLKTSSNDSAPAEDNSVSVVQKSERTLTTSSNDSAAAEDNSGSVVQKSERTLKTSSKDSAAAEDNSGSVVQQAERTLTTSSKDSAAVEDNSVSVVQQAERTLKNNTDTKQILLQYTSSTDCGNVIRKSEQVHKTCSNKKSADQSKCRKVKNKTDNNRETMMRRGAQFKERSTTEETTLKSGKQTAIVFMCRLRHLIETPSTRNLRVLKQGKKQRKVKKLGRNDETGIVPPIVEQTSINSQRRSIRQSSRRSNLRESRGAASLTYSRLDISGRECGASPPPRVVPINKRKSPHSLEQTGEIQEDVSQPQVDPTPLQVSVDMRWIDGCSDGNVPTTNYARNSDVNDQARENTTTKQNTTPKSQRLTASKSDETTGRF